MSFFNFGKSKGSKNNLIGSNPFGAAIDPNLIQQLNARGIVKARSSKTQEEISLLNSNTGWCKLSSGMNLGGDSTLASQNILFGGTLYKDENNFSLTQGFNYADSNASYENDPLDRGIVPKPGITSFSFESYGNYGATTKTQINFKLFNLKQFVLFEELYLKIGGTVLVEFGNSMYVNRQLQVVSDVETVPTFFNNNITQTDIELEIQRISKNANFNYGGRIGTVSNYQVKLQKDNTYDVSVDITGKGTVLEQMKATGKPRPSIAGPGSVDKNKKAEEGESLISSEAASSISSLADDLGSISALNEAEKIESLSKLSPITDILDIYQKNINGTEAFEEVKSKYNRCEWLSQDRPVFLCKANTEDLEANMVYIKLDSFMKIINDTLLPIGNKGEKIITFAASSKNGNIYSKFASYANHFALDPRISILPRIPLNENLYTGYRKKTLFTTGKVDNIYDIWLNVNFLKEKLKEMSKNSEDSSVDLISYLDEVLSEVETNMGGYSDLNLSFIQETSTYVIIDDKVVSGYNIESSEINLEGLKSIVSDVTLDTKVSSAASAQAAILSRNPQYKSTINDQLFHALGRSEDRMKVVIKDTTGDEIVDNVDSDTEDGVTVPESPPPVTIESYEDAIKQFIGQKQIKQDDFDTLFENYISYTNKQFIRLFGSAPFGKLPYSLKMTMDGIEGFTIAGKFKVAPGVLPDYLSERSFYTVTKANHKVEGNRWTTDIEATPSITSGPQGEKFAEKEDPTAAKALDSSIVDKLEKETLAEKNKA